MIEQLSIQEHDDMVISAMFGSLDDLQTEFSSEDRARSDEEIMNAVAGVYQAGSEYYNGELAQTMQLFDQFAARLGAMACNHDHFMQSALEAPEDKPSQELSHHGHKHDEDDSDDDDEIDPKTGKRRKKRKWLTYK